MASVTFLLHTAIDAGTKHHFLPESPASRE